VTARSRPGRIENPSDRAKLNQPIIVAQVVTKPPTKAAVAAMYLKFFDGG
jgi:hypothetical protein